MFRRAPRREDSGAQFGPYYHYIEWGITGLPTIFGNLALWFVMVRVVLGGVGGLTCDFAGVFGCFDSGCAQGRYRSSQLASAPRGGLRG